MILLPGIGGLAQVFLPWLCSNTGNAEAWAARLQSTVLQVGFCSVQQGSQVTALHNVKGRCLLLVQGPKLHLAQVQPSLVQGRGMCTMMYPARQFLSGSLCRKTAAELASVIAAVAVHSHWRWLYWSIAGEEIITLKSERGAWGFHDPIQQ